jgi:Zn-dependent metalloprotease
MKPIFCILPPHILESIARNASEELRDAALQTLLTDASTRHIRAAEQFRQQAAPAAPTVQTLSPHKQRAIYTCNNGTTLPGSLRRSEGQAATGDAAVDEAYTGLGRSISTGGSSDGTPSTTPART